VLRERPVRCRTVGSLRIVSLGTVWALIGVSMPYSALNLGQRASAFTCEFQRPATVSVTLRRIRPCLLKSSEIALVLFIFITHNLLVGTRLKALEC
jgi:hypothetical protein